MDTLTAQEVSAEYRIPLPTLRWWVQSSTGPKSFKLGRRRLYKRSDVEAWIEHAYQTTATGGAA